MEHEAGVGTRVGEGRRECARFAATLAHLWILSGTLLRQPPSTNWSGAPVGEFNEWPRKAGMTSENAAAARRFDRRLREKIIGHTMAVCRPGAVGGGLRLRRVNGGFALLHQPTSNHCGGVFLEPLIQQRSNFLAEIGGVAESSEFVGLQRVARSRQEKFPRGLGAVSGHGPLPPAGTGTAR